MDTVNIAQKFSQIHEYWKPHIAADFNGQQLKLSKLKGEFVFHHHDHEDELFLVVKGRFRMEFKPVADEECWLLLFEPAGTLNTGNVVNERTHHDLERV